MTPQPKRRTSGRRKRLRRRHEDNLLKPLQLVVSPESPTGYRLPGHAIETPYARKIK